MAKLFPKEHIIGFLSSIALTVAALLVLFLEVSFGIKMAILLITAGLQASLQLFLFMHINESKERRTLYTNILYALFVALITIFGSMFVLLWDW